MTMSILMVSVVFMVIGMIVQGRLRSKFAQYSKMPVSGGLNGAEVAEKMLKDNGTFDVKITSVQGQLTDHYNPVNKTVNLSEDVYNGRSVAAAAVAAHECGHAVQHAKAYSMLTLRSKLVPLVQVSSNFSQWIILAGLGLGFGSGNNTILLVGIALFALSTLFAVITLPVEFDASNRALAWMQNASITSSREQEGAKDALKWAALTYVVAALASIAMLLQYVMIFLGRRDD